jgi:Reverse transcriptase (RNA-dependent DNA polymerase)
MSLEIQALRQNNTWTLVPLLPNQNIVGCKWVYKIKRCADGSIEQYKARLVTKDYNQEEGVDYFETFNPVVQPTTIRLVLF